MNKINSFLLFSSLLCTITVCYAQTVTIGTQVWMTKNLNVDTFRNGDKIPEAKTAEEWVAYGKARKAAWCYYDNDPANGEKYGKLYNWYAVNDPRGLAPTGYHVPSDAEWTTLINYLGVDAGSKMKNTSVWDSYTIGGGSKTCLSCRDWNTEYRKKVPCHTCEDTRSIPLSGNGTNLSGFSGLPGGVRATDGPFYGVGKTGNWWSSTAISPPTYEPNAWTRSLYCSNGSATSYYYFKISGFSVRCLKD